MSTEWTHVAGTYDGAVMKLYINGVEEGELKTDANADFNGEWAGDVGTPGDTLQLKYGSETLYGGILPNGDAFWQICVKVSCLGG